MHADTSRQDGAEQVLHVRRCAVQQQQQQACARQNGQLGQLGQVRTRFLQALVHVGVHECLMADGYAVGDEPPFSLWPVPPPDAAAQLGDPGRRRSASDNFARRTAWGQNS